MEAIDIFAKKAKLRMEELHLTQADLAKRLNVEQPAVSLYLRGKRNPGIDTAIRWAEALDVPVGWLLNDSDDSQILLREPTKIEIAETVLSSILDEGKLLTAITLLLRNGNNEPFLDGALAVLSVGLDSSPNQSQHKAGVR